MLNIRVEEVQHGVHHVLSSLHTMVSVMNQYSQSEDSASVFPCVNRLGGQQWNNEPLRGHKTQKPH